MKKLLFVAALFFTGSLSACSESAPSDGPEDSATSDSDSDDANDTQTESDSGATLDTEYDTQDTDSAVVSDFAGTWSGAASGEEEVKFVIDIQPVGEFLVRAHNIESGEVIAVNGTIEEDAIEFVVEDTVDINSVQIAYSGSFRHEEENVYAFGEWSSSTGFTGVWGAWRTTNELPLTDTTMEYVCSHSNAVCGDGMCPEMEFHSGGGTCNLFYAAAKSTTCLDLVVAQWNSIEGMTAADCPSLQTNPVGWEENNCPDINPCYAPLPNIPPMPN